MSQLDDTYQLIWDRLNKMKMTDSRINSIKKKKKKFKKTHIVLEI